MAERRNCRSTHPVDALTLFLHAARRKLGVRAITVATPDGTLVAGSGSRLDRVASVGAKVDMGEPLPVRSAAAVATWRIRVGVRELVITSAGRRMTSDLGDGVRRILTEMQAV